jgi:hypothetical protein
LAGQSWGGAGAGWPPAAPGLASGRSAAWPYPPHCFGPVHRKAFR